MAFTLPAQSNTYVPEVTKKLVVDYSRNIKDFPLNEYVQIVPVDKQVGYYLEMNREEAGRILRTNGANFLWADGDDRPTHNNETESFQFNTYSTRRYDFGFNLGQLAEEQAVFNIIAHNAAQKAEQAMRFRTAAVVAAATTSANYDSTHVSDVAAIAGASGKWDVSTTARKDIKRSLDYAADLIIQDSLNGVKPEDLILVVSRYTARLLSISQEIVDHIKGSTDAYKEISGSLPNRNRFFGLPERLYGYKVVVEDSAKVTSKKGASSVSRSGVLANTTAFMCARPGSLISERASESASFATHVLFMKEEMTVEEFRDPKHRRVEYHVAEDYAAVVAGKVSGFLFTNTVT